MWNRVDPDSWRNRTPHPIRIYGPVGSDTEHKKVLTIPRSDTVFRIATSVRDGIMTVGTADVTHDPTDNRTDQQYIVSLPFAMAYRGVLTLWVPYDEIRSDSGTVIGCRSLVRLNHGS